MKTPVKDLKRFIISQRFTAMINRYECFAYDGTTQGERVAFAEQKRLKIKEEITLYSDDTKSETVFTMKAEKAFDLRSKYFVNDAAGNQIGYLKKQFKASLIRSTWEVCDAGGQQLALVQEVSVPIAILRRYGGIIPVVGGFLNYLPFNFQLLREGAEIGTVRRIFGLRDKYDVHVTDNAPFDGRLILALGVALDALQAR